MICFNCAYKIPSEDRKECPLCGMKFPQRCNNCGSPNPLMAKFCFNCGDKLLHSKTQSSLENTQTLSENRKYVAVIFADVSGFTSLSEKMDPEEVREIINDCFEYITKPVYELEGTIDKYIGDCVMILFGAKHTHHNDHERAVLCAMKMHKLIQKYSDEILSSKGINLNLSIGINYGLVVTGKVGNYFDKDYTVLGDVVNTAQRMQTMADKGTTLVSESIYIETKDVIDYSEEKEFMVKNKKKAVKCYSPITVKSIKGKESAMLIGRETILDTLNQWYICNSSKSMTVVGEAGIGKTTIIKKFVENINDNVKKIWIDCNPTYQNKLYYIIADMLYRVIDSSLTDSNLIKRKQLLTFLKKLLKGKNEEEIKKNYNFLGLVIGLDREGDFQNILNAMNYEDIVSETLNQLNIFFENLIEYNRLIIVIDDLQWSDSSSLYVLKKLIARNSKLRNSFIFTTRYNLDALNDLGKEINHMLDLKELTKNNVNRLLEHLLGCKKVHNSIFDFIQKFATGNPLYIIELISSIKRKEQYFIKDNIAYLELSQNYELPTNIEKLILENLSEFDETVMHFLEIASVVGKEFNISWIQNMLEDDIFEESKITMITNLLTDKDIISPKDVQLTSGSIERIYIFNKDLIREVIYKSILNKNKKNIHQKIGSYIEQRYAKGLEDYYEVLCLHFEKSESNEKARRYYYKTAMKHKNNFNLRDSLYYFEKYIKLAKFIKSDNKEIEVVRALASISDIYFTLTDYDKSLEYLNEALQVAWLTEDIYRINIMIATIYKVIGKYKEALELIDEMDLKIRPNDSIYGKLLHLKCNILRLTGNPKVLDLVEKSEEILLKNRDYENLSATLNEAGIMHYIKGDIDISFFYLNKAYGYAEKVNNLKIMGKISGNLGIMYHATGSISKAIESNNKSISISKKISNLLDYIGAINNLGILYMEMGLFNKAESLFEESLTEARKRGLPYDECISLINLGDLMYERGEEEKALNFYEQSKSIAIKHGMAVEEGINYTGFAKLHLKNKEYKEAYETLNKSYKIFKEADEFSYIGEYYMYMSVYELSKKGIKETMEFCQKSIDYAVESKDDYMKLKGLRIKSIILTQENKYEKAIEELTESLKLSQQLESNYELAKGYYQKFIIFYEQSLKQEAYDTLLKSKEAIEKTEDNRWMPIISQTLEKIQNNAQHMQFYEDFAMYI